jgi:hypothetical protein
MIAMRKILFILLLSTFLCSTAWSIQRVPKGKDIVTERKDSSKEEQIQLPQEQNQPEEIIDSRELNREKKKEEKKYDYFIDKNKNGIDDRLEKNIGTDKLLPKKEVKEKPSQIEKRKEEEKRKEIEERKEKEKQKEFDRKEEEQKREETQRGPRRR